MSILAIDIGNSRIKWGLFQGCEIIRQHAFEYAFTSTSLEQLLDNEDMPVEGNKLVISNVAGDEVKETLVNWLNARGCDDYLFAKTGLKLCGVTNAYEMPDALGVDRWLAIVAAYHHVMRSSDESVCVIDCGTAITLDVVNCQGMHMGGLIMPGLQTMREALLRKTKAVRIDMQNRDIEVEGRLASSTEDAVDQGCAQLMVEGLSAIVKKHQHNERAKLLCLVTGGDGSWVAKKMGVMNTFDPYLVFNGLRLLSENNALANNSDIN